MNDQPKDLSDLLEPGSTVMVAIDHHEELEFRPLTVSAVDGSTLGILLDTSASWTDRELDGCRAYVTMSDTRSNTWVSIVGVCSTSTDPARIDELWSSFADAYFDDGRSTPGITVLDVTARRGEYWSAPSGRIGSLISVVRAKFGDPEESGDTGPVRV